MKSLPIIVKIPQLDRFGYSDYISISLAIIAMLAIAGSVWISNRQNELAIRQLNREERKKLYVPVLAMMAAEWQKFDERMLLLAIPGAIPPFGETDENLEILKAKIHSYEFEVEEELLGSRKVSGAIDIWFKKLGGVMKLFDEYQSENLRASLLPLNAGPEWKSQRDKVLLGLLKESGVVKEDLASIVELVRGEIDMTQKGLLEKFWGHGRGTRERKPMKNGEK